MSVLWQYGGIKDKDFHLSRHGVQNPQMKACQDKLTLRRPHGVILHRSCAVGRSRPAVDGPVALRRAVLHPPAHSLVVVVAVLNGVEAVAG